MNKIIDFVGKKSKKGPKTPDLADLSIKPKHCLAGFRADPKLQKAWDQIAPVFYFPKSAQNENKNLGCYKNRSFGELSAILGGKIGGPQHCKGLHRSIYPPCLLDPAVHGMGATKWVVWALQIDPSVLIQPYKRFLVTGFCVVSGCARLWFVDLETFSTNLP